MINGVKIKKLTIHKDERGSLMEIFRCDDELFKKFGQVYYTTANPGMVKAWHYHKKQTDNFTCIKGTMRLVLYDDRKDSKTKGELMELLIDKKNPILVSIPPEVYHGFESATEEEAMAINIPTLPYNAKNPDEYRLPFNTEKIKFKWKGTKGG